MNYFKEYDDYIIKSCNKEDIDLVGSFLNAYWSEGHILYIDKIFRDWQYYNKRRNNYNFLLAREKHTGDIHGIIGFIPTYLYDDSLSDKDKFVWLTSWMVHPDISASSNLGMRLLAAVPYYEKVENIGTVGNYDSVVPLYKMMKFETGRLEHYFCLNDSKHDFSIAGLPPDFIEQQPSFKQNGLKSSLYIIDWRDFASLYDGLGTKNIYFPIKTSEYFYNRYHAHPRYKYEIMSIGTYDTPICAFIFRAAQHENACVLRIVDGLGDFSLVGNVYESMQNLLNERNAEYLDIYCHGIDGGILENMGFTKHGFDDRIVIPNFFEPFERKNRNVNYACLYPYDKKLMLFRGDGDQDRPNMKQGDVWRNE